MTPAELLPSTYRARRYNLDIVERAVCGAFRLTPEQLRQTSRKRRVAWPRAVAEWLSRELTTAPLKEIAARFGHTDHTTVIHSERLVRDMMASHPQVRAEIEELKRAVEDSVVQET